jgi:cyclophilin family peptidyl-prolyl cis-trans isomerase
MILKNAMPPVGFLVCVLLALANCKTSTKSISYPTKANETSATIITSSLPTKSRFTLVPDTSNIWVEMKTTKGNIQFELYNNTPEHQENFLKLMKLDYYNSTLFHRVINGFVVQGGSPDSRNAPTGKYVGGGGTGYTIQPELFEAYVHTKGALAAARLPDEQNPNKESSGCQFYFVHGRTLNDNQINEFEKNKGLVYTNQQRKLLKEQGGSPQLDREYTVFGHIFSGFEVLDSIAVQKTDAYGRPETDVKIISVHLLPKS